MTLFSERQGWLRYVRTIDLRAEDVAPALVDGSVLKIEVLGPPHPEPGVDRTATNDHREPLMLMGVA